jgi:hypothetical protein
MGVRHAADYPPAPDDRYAWTDEGATVTTGRYPVVHVPDCWDIVSAFALAAPGVRHSYEGTDDGRVTAVMVHDDGSWARATGHHGQPPTVHQAGPRRLWDILDDLRHHWLSNGALPPHGARVRIDRDGTLHLKRGTWTAVIPPAPAPAPAVAATP